MAGFVTIFVFLGAAGLIIFFCIMEKLDAREMHRMQRRREEAFREIKAQALIYVANAPDGAQLDDLKLAVEILLQPSKLVARLAGEKLCQHSKPAA